MSIDVKNDLNVWGDFSSQYDTWGDFSSQYDSSDTQNGKRSETRDYWPSVHVLLNVIWDIISGYMTPGERFVLWGLGMPLAPQNNNTKAPQTKAHMLELHELVAKGELQALRWLADKPKHLLNAVNHPCARIVTIELRKPSAQKKYLMVRAYDVNCSNYFCPAVFNAHRLRDPITFNEEKKYSWMPRTMNQTICALSGSDATSLITCAAINDQTETLEWLISTLPQNSTAEWKKYGDSLTDYLSRYVVATASVKTLEVIRRWGAPGWNLLTRQIGQIILIEERNAECRTADKIRWLVSVGGIIAEADFDTRIFGPVEQYGGRMLYSHKHKLVCIVPPKEASATTSGVPNEPWHQKCVVL